MDRQKSYRKIKMEGEKERGSVRVGSRERELEREGEQGRGGK